MVDIICQAHGLPLESGDRRDAGLVPTTQYRAFLMLFSFVPIIERQETECRAVAIGTVVKGEDTVVYSLLAFQGDHHPH